MRILRAVDLSQVRRARVQLEAVLCTESLAFFFARAWAVVEPTRALMPSVATDAFCAAGQAIADGRLKRLGVETCPGTGKSLFWAVVFPAWLLLRQRGRARVMAGSYSHAFAERDGTRCRDLVQSEWYRGLVAALGEDWQIREDVNQKGNWWTTATGRRLITSVSGATVGHRCTYQIIDDPLSEADVFSTTNKAESIRWVFEVMPSRLEDQRVDSRVVVMQRLDVLDALGEARKRGWPILSLPAVLGMWGVPDEGCVLFADDGTEIWRDRRKPGEPIIELLDLPTLESSRVEHGPTVFAAKYLQRPHDDSTTMFQRAWLTRRWTELPERFDRMVITLDASFKEGKKADYAVVQAWGALGGDRYLVDQWRKQAGFVETTDALLAMHDRFRFAKILVEEAANGHAIIDQLKRIVAGIVPVKASEGGGGGGGGKQARAASVQAIVASGAIVLPAHAPWVHAWLDEVSGFPGGTKNDDQVDAMVYALRELQSSDALARTKALTKARALIAR